MSVPWEKYPVFAGLNAEALAFLRSRARTVAFAKDEIIVREGELGNRLFLLDNGAVNVCKNHGGAAQLELAHLKVGDFFGEMCILETLPRAATVVAAEPALLHSLTGVAFYEFYQAMPAQYSILVLNIARDVSRRLRKLDDRFAAHH